MKSDSARSQRGPATGARLLVGLFVLGLGAPLSVALLEGDPGLSPEVEALREARRPHWDWDMQSIQSFPRAFESDYANELPLHTLLARGNALRQLALFDKYPNESMYVGLEGSWFWGQDNARELMRGLMPLGKDELERWCSGLVAQARWCRSLGIDYVFVVGPSKEMIYPELVPAKWNRVGPTRCDQLVERLRGNGVPLLDLRPAIAEEKRHDRPELEDFTYYPLGTHWTDRGCWAAYSAIERALAARGEPFTPIAREDFTLVQVDLPTDSWADRALVGDVYSQPYLQLQPKGGWGLQQTREIHRGESYVVRHGPDPSHPRGLEFRDSFGFKVDELLARDCSELVQSNLHTFDARLVEELRPDFVVQIYIDLKLAQPPPVLEPIDVQALDRARFEASSATLGELVPPPAEAALAAGAAREFPPVQLERQRFAELRLRLDASAAGALELACGTRRFVLAYAAGRNELFQRILGRDLAAGTRISNAGPGAVALRGLELRAERP